MSVYLGRQPILDVFQRIAGYELLFRSSAENFCVSTDPAEATSQVILNALIGFGLDRLVGGKPAFINFDRTQLIEGVPRVLPSQKIVIEILETVPADHDVLSACQALRQEGYVLALDDCVLDERTLKFAPCVDILKIDFRETSPAQRKALADFCATRKLKAIAEKVETRDEFKQAVRLGYQYFQGYFFAHPSVLQTSRVPASQLNGLRLIRLVQDKELNFAAIEAVVRHDISFSYALLRYLNSPLFAWGGKVESVRHGLALLGEDEVRKWAWITTLSFMGEKASDAVIEWILMRGRFCEAIALAGSAQTGRSDPFLVGMFSLLDIILGRPLAGILEDLNISAQIREVLVGDAEKSDPLSLVLDLVKSYEAADWESVDRKASRFGISAERLHRCYLESLSWVDAIADSQERRKSPNPTGFRTNAFDIPSHPRHEAKHI